MKDVYYTWDKMLYDAKKEGCWFGVDVLKNKRRVMFIRRSINDIYSITFCIDHESRYINGTNCTKYYFNYIGWEKIKQKETWGIIFDSIYKRKEAGYYIDLDGINLRPENTFEMIDL